jgi:hypothetical protein
MVTAVVDYIYVPNYGHFRPLSILSKIRGWDLNPEPHDVRSNALTTELHTSKYMFMVMNIVDNIYVSNYNHIRPVSYLSKIHGRDLNPELRR